MIPEGQTETDGLGTCETSFARGRIFFGGFDNLYGGVSVRANIGGLHKHLGVEPGTSVTFCCPWRF